MTPGPVTSFDTFYRGLMWIQLGLAVLMVGWGLRTTDRWARPFLPQGLALMILALGFFSRGLAPEWLRTSGSLLAAPAAIVWQFRLVRQARRVSRAARNRAS